MDLDVDVVPRFVVAQPGDEPERAAGEADQHHRRADVSHRLVLGEAERRAGRGHLHRFLAEEPARDVEVMDELILELAARGRDVRVGWRQAVAADHDEREHVTDLSSAYLIACRAVSRIEAALKADLQLSPRALDVRDDVACLGDADRDRLLAERRDPRVEAALDQRRVRVGRGHDDRGIDTRERLVDRGGGPNAQCRGDVFGASVVRVVDA